MRSWIAACVLMSCANTSPPHAGPQGAISGADAWAVVGGGADLEVRVERALYELSGSAHFFVHVRVVSARPSARAADLTGYHEVFYPNQWGASDTPHRAAIDERRKVLPPFDDAAKAKVVADFRAGKLAPLEGVLDYYVEFNAGAKGDVDAQSRGHAFVIVVMDGQLRVSDGESADRAEPRTTDDAREVTIEAPVRWREVPPGARVVRDSP